MPYKRHDKDGNAVTAIASYARHDKDGNPVALSKYVRHDKDGNAMVQVRDKFQRRDSSNTLDSPQPESRTFVDDFGNIYRNYSADYEARDKDGNLLNDYESVFNRTVLDLNFAGNKSLIDAVSGNDLVTFSRASSGTFVDSDGLIKTTPVNYALNSNIVQGSNIGTPILNSTESVVSPRGITETVRRLGRDIEAGGAQVWRVGSTSGGTPNTTYTISFFAKTVSGGTTNINIDINDVAPSGGQEVTITGEWTRITKTGGSANNNLRFFDMNMVTATEDFYVWGAQIEIGTVLNDYIPTTSTISGAPRFDHNPSTGESLGLLTEESSTNRNTKSKSFSVWGVSSGFSLVYDAATAPDGTTSATALDRNGGGLARLEANFNVGSGGDTTFSVFAKSVNTTTGRYLRLAVNDAQTGERFADFDLVDGTIDDAASNGGNFTNAASRIEKYPNDWYRCSISFSKTSSGSENSLCFHKLYIRQSDNSTNTPSEVTDVGMYIWGGQVEQKTFPTSLIETDGSTVTRAADVAEITGTNFSSFYNQTAGTIFVDNSYIGLDDFSFVLDYSDGTLDNRHSLFYLTNANPITLRGRTRVSSDQSTLEVAIPASGVFAKTAYAYASNDFAMSSDGSSVLTDTNGSIPTINQLTIGATFANASVYSGHIKRIAYFNTRLSNTILETITS